jgi:hypothetical protein
MGVASAGSKEGGTGSGFKLGLLLMGSGCCGERLWWGILAD